MTFAQETKKYSIEFSKVDLKTAIDLIEKKTNLVAFYDIDWISKSTIIIESNYTNATLEDILEGVFSKTDLNYYLTENKIIFTKNSIIYDKLPENYISSVKGLNNEIENNQKPILYRDVAVNKENFEKTEAVGKENLNSKKAKFLLSGFVKDVKTGKPLVNVTVDRKSVV